GAWQLKASTAVGAVAPSGSTAPRLRWKVKPRVAVAVLNGPVSSQHRIEQSWEARIEVLTTEAVQARGADLVLMDHAGLAQNPKVRRERPLGHVQIEAAAAARLLLLRQLAHDAQPLRVTQRVQH